MGRRRWVGVSGDEEVGWRRWGGGSVEEEAGGGGGRRRWGGVGGKV